MGDDMGGGDCTTDGTCEEADTLVGDTPAGAGKPPVPELPLEMQTQQAIQQLSISKGNPRT